MRKLIGFDPKLGKFTSKQLQEDTRAVIAGEKKIIVSVPSRPDRTNGMPTP